MGVRGINVVVIYMGEATPVMSWPVFIGRVG